MKQMKIFAAPYLVWMVVFILVPLLMVAYFALTNDEGRFTIQYVSDVGQYANIFVRSIWLALIATVICLIMAYPLAFILSRMDKHKQGTMLLIVMLPMWMNFLLRTYAWMTLLGNNGIINYLFGLVGLGPFKLINTSGGHSIGVPLAVSSRVSYIVPSATMTIHPVRISGTVIGTPQTYYYFERMQDRIVSFVCNHSKISPEKFKDLMLATDQIATDTGSIIDGKEATSLGLIDKIGGLRDAIECLEKLIKDEKS